MQRQIKCKICGKEHALGGCPAYKNIPEVKNVSIMQAGLKDALNNQAGVSQAMLRTATDTLRKPKMGRPRTGYIKAEYNRQYMADLRTIKRLGLSVTVAQYRKSKEE